MTSHTYILIWWFVLILFETARNWYLIEKRRVDIDHVWMAISRIVVSVVFWIASVVIYHDLPFESWLFMPVMMALTFWFLFDIGLNLMRGKSILYFGKGSKLDRLQAQWPLPWVWFKFLLAAASVQVFYSGLGII